MYRKLTNKKISLLKHKQELHIMQVRKFGKINRMIQNVIFGHMVVFCIKCVIFSHLFKEMILMICLIIYKKENLNLYRRFIQIN
jgi:hypothetical protein